MNEIKIGNFIIGQKKEPFIIGEAGINHNGEIKKAFEMIELGKKSGLNAIKKLDSRKLVRMQKKCMELIDGRGTERVAKQISLIAGK